MTSIADVIVRQRVEGTDLSRIPAQLRAIPATVNVRIAVVVDNRTAQQGLAALQAQSTSLAKTQPTIAPRVDTSSLQTLINTTSGVDRASKSATTSAATFERALRTEATSAITNARAHGDYGRALQLVSQEEQAAAGNKARLNQLDTQRIAILKQEEQAATKAARAGGGAGSSVSGLPVLPRSVESFGSGAISQFRAVAGAVGIATTAVEAFNQALGAGQAGLALRQSENLTKVLTRSTAEYASVIGTAREQQGLFGGSLQENIEGLQGLVVVSRSSGAELRTLVDLSQRLSILDPAQGAIGARVALSEALSGNPASLSRRYEIPRTALKRLSDESVPVTKRLQIVSDFLDKVGISSGTAARAIDDTTRAYRDFNAARDEIKTGAGQGLADLFAPVAQGAATLIRSGSDVRQALQQQASQAFAVSQTYEQYQANIQRVAAANGGLAFSVTALNEQQFNAARAIAVSGQASAQDAATKVTQTGAVANAIAQYQTMNPVLAENASRILQLAATSPAAAKSLKALVDQVGLGNLQAPGFVAQLAQMEGWLRSTADASADAARRQGEHNIALGDATAALQAEIAQSALDAAQSEATGQAKALLTQRAKDAADAILRSGDASSAAVARMAAITGLAPSLISAYLGIAQAAEAARVAMAWSQGGQQDFRAGERGLGSAAAGIAGRNLAAANQARATEQVQAAAISASILATGTYSQKLAELTRLRNQYVKGSADYINAQTQINLLVQSQNRVKGGASPVFTPSERVDLASGNDRADLALLEQKLAGLTRGTKEYASVYERIQTLRAKIARADETAGNRALSDARDLRRAQEDLMSDEERLIALRQDEQAATSEVERLRIVKQIEDTEKRIQDAKKAAADAALDLQIAQNTDAQKRLKEARELADAEQVINSGKATEELKQAAILKRNEILLDQQKRASDIADLQTKAGSAAPAAAQAPANQSGRRTGGQPVAPSLSLDQAVTVGAAAGVAAAQAAPIAAPVPVAPVTVAPLVPVLDSSVIGDKLADAVRGWAITVNVDEDGGVLVDLLRSGETARAGAGYGG